MSDPRRVREFILRHDPTGEYTKDSLLDRLDADDWPDGHPQRTERAFNDEQRYERLAAMMEALLALESGDDLYRMYDWCECPECDYEGSVARFADPDQAITYPEVADGDE